MHLVTSDRPGWSKSALAAEFGVDRRTAAKLVEGIAPCGEERGQPTWRMRDVAGAFARFIGPGGVGGYGPDFDPRELPPKERKDYFDSEIRRVQLAKLEGEAIDAGDVREHYGAMMQTVKGWTLTIADRLERDAELSPHQVARVVDSCDGLLTTLHDALVTSASGCAPVDS